MSHSQTVDTLMTLPGRATQQSQDTRKTSQAKHPALSSNQDDQNIQLLRLPN